MDGYAAVHNITLKKRVFRSYQFGTAPVTNSTIFVAKPLTYLNGSGKVLPSLLRLSGAKLAEIVVVCDNIDLPAGAVRIKQRGGASSHNGLRSVMEALCTGEFARVYIGVGRPTEPMDVVAHVLSRPLREERGLLESGVKRAVEAITLLETEEFAAVANVFNRKE